jgi:type III restriction enzyme
MAKRIHFQFDPNLGFQADAVNAVVDLFKGLPKYATGLHSGVDPVRRKRANTFFNSVRNVDIVTGERLKQNLRAVQLRNGLFSDSSGTPGTHFTIEMETGTGKTYVYLRTILRLHEEYGFTKFMIVVPSVAIRMGVEKSIQLLTSHFQPMFNLKLSKHCHVYNSGQLEAFISEYTNPRDLSIAVLNIQAFNSKDTKLRSGTESREPFWDELKYIRPIVIIDEPQRILGVKAKSKSFAAIEELDPLFMLGYSATHRHKYNPIYKLDSFDAFQNNLVKTISVRTVHSAIPKDFPYIRYLDFTGDLLARVEIFSRERGGAVQFKPFKVRAGVSLYELSGELPQYRNWRIDEDPHRDKPLKIAKDKGALEINRGETNYEALSKDAARVLIRLTIDRHDL